MTYLGLNRWNCSLLTRNLSHQNRSRQPHPMRRLFILLGCRIIRVAAHDEFTCRNPHEFHADSVRPVGGGKKCPARRRVAMRLMAESAHHAMPQFVRFPFSSTVPCSSVNDHEPRPGFCVRGNLGRGLEWGELKWRNFGVDLALAKSLRIGAPAGEGQVARSRLLLDGWWPGRSSETSPPGPVFGETSAPSTIQPPESGGRDDPT